MPAQATEQYLVAEYKLHNPPRWVRKLVIELMTRSSVIVARTLTLLRDSLTVEWLGEPEKSKMSRATLRLHLPEKLRERVRNLLDPNRKPRKKKDGTQKPEVERRVLNSYGFIEEHDSERPGCFLAVVRLMERVDTGEKTAKGEPKFRKETIAVTTGLQQLIQSFVTPAGLETLPRELQAGVAQEIAQQIMSHVMLKESGEVDAANFPTVEERDPVLRTERYRTALGRVGRKPHELERKPYAEVNPQRFARIMAQGPQAVADKLAKRVVIADPDWHEAVRTPFPPRSTLFFVTADACKVYRGHKEVDANLTKADICRGTERWQKGMPRAHRRASCRLGQGETKWREKRHKAAERGSLAIRPYFVALPLINPDDEKVGEILRERDSRIASQHHRHGSSGRGWDFNLKSTAMWGEEEYRPHSGKRKVISRYALVPLEFGNEQLALLQDPKVTPCWSRVVAKGDDLYWQLTYKQSVPRPPETKRVLGVHFGIGHLAWALLDEDGTIDAEGVVEGNPHLMQHLQTAEERTWDQKAGRWVGGRVSFKKLRTATYTVVSQIIELAGEHKAQLCVEDINWVNKKAASTLENQRFSGWNYGQLRRILGYKAPLGGVGMPLTASDYVVNLTCPECGAIRQKGQKKETADTHFNAKTSVLTCRKCGFEGELTSRMKALAVARWGRGLIMK